jgi:hypothetical protein
METLIDHLQRHNARNRIKWLTCFYRPVVKTSIAKAGGNRSGYDGFVSSNHNPAAYPRGQRLYLSGIKCDGVNLGTVIAAIALLPDPGRGCLETSHLTSLPLLTVSGKPLLNP